MGGTFCVCFYIQWQNRHTDWFISKLYQPKGFFTPPYETLASLRQRLAGMYFQAEVSAVKGKSTAIARSHSSSIAALRGILETHTAEA